MRLLLASSVVALLSVGASACGSASKGADTPLRTSSDAAASGDVAATSTSHAVPPGGYLKNDGDSDDDDNGHGTGDVGRLLKEFRYKADRADTRAIAALVKSYYAAAASGDGTKACSLLDSSLATGFVESQDQSAHSAPGGGRSCAASLSLLFKQQHRELASDEVATMVVTAVHVEGKLGLAELGFRAAPEAELVLEREGRAWKVGALFDSKLP